MAHRKITLALAALLSLSLLASCGGRNNAPQETETVPPTAALEPSQAPDTPAPVGTPAPTETPAPETDAPAETSPVAPDELRVTLSKTDVTLTGPGKTFTLRAQSEGTPAGISVALSWSSSDESIATVSNNPGGDSVVVTAVGPGTATITASAIYSTAVDQPLTVSCIVRCRWTEETPEPTAPTATAAPVESTPVETTAPAPASADLAAFYEDTMSKYEFGFLSLADTELMDNFYPGLSDISTEQCLVYICMMSMNNGEFVLVQVQDSGDVSAVKAVLQARIDGMVDGGAWYPAAIEEWETHSRVVSNGNYVMMVVHENADSIVSEFNAFTS